MAKSILQLGKEVILGEAKVLHKVATRLSIDFTKAVEAINNINRTGRLVLSGMGKAGIIANKISATFASIGIPSFFLHPAEAVHGDMGRTSSDDIFILLSNSGETEELVRLLNLIKRTGSKLISITATSNSTLGKHSDIVIALGKIEEVCPIKLAPTASTTAMLAVGDALAMTLVARKKISERQFALFHPAGSLGRSLTTVAEVMRSGKQHAVVEEQTPAKNVIKAINRTIGRPGAATIINKHGKLVGFCTDGDFIRALANGKDFLEKPISKIMTRKPKTIHQDKTIAEAARIMNSKKIDQLIVIDKNNNPVGLVDVQDVLG